MKESKFTIKVSDLTKYMICPRQVYFCAKGYEVKRKEKNTVESLVFKELAFNLHEIVEEEEADAKSIIEDIVEEMRWIYKEELKGVENSSLEEVKNNIICSLENTDWLKKIKSENKLLGLEEAHEYEREYTMVSQKLNMSGSVDKLIRIGDEIIPGMIKTGRCPRHGLWRRDRVQLAAYAMLIEEKFETTVKRGFVEYIRDAEFRESLIRRSDRAMVLLILKRIKRINRGAFPEKGENAPCDNCSFEELCELKKTVFSKIFGR